MLQLNKRTHDDRYMCISNTKYQINTLHFHILTITYMEQDKAPWCSLQRYFNVSNVNETNAFQSTHREALSMSHVCVSI